ncbi:MAG: hypothetical protein MUC91_11415 [Verrucomicrobia bacterium]|jgi:hypothetical protein|nr:hypothetical protein [Verrucomicrobiota bacterium]
MKLHSTFRPGETGGTLIAVLVITFVIGATLASYLRLTQHQALANHRSQVWNRSLTVSEAGVEEALQFINKYASDSARLTDWSSSSSVAEDQWYDYGNGWYGMWRWLGDNYEAGYWVTITNRAWGPIITSYGYTLNKHAYNPYAANGGSKFYPRWTSRVVHVETAVDGLFRMAMVADQRIDLNGNNITTDSFDSGNPSYSSGGRYDAAKRKANGDVASNLDLVNSIDIGNANIMGNVSTGPGGTVAIGPNGSVGDLAWVLGGNNGIQPGHVNDDMNVRLQTVTLPTTTWLPMPAGRKINGTTYTHVIDSSGDYRVSSIAGSVYVNTNVTARIHVTGNVSLTGKSDEIRLAAVGTKVTFYMGGTSFKVKGNGVVNESALAENFMYFGLPSNTAIDFGGNGAFAGAIYAPNADFTLGGGGNNAVDFAGASVTKTVTMNGHFNFHYDEALGRIGGDRGYLPVSWAELN